MSFATSSLESGICLELLSVGAVLFRFLGVDDDTKTEPPSPPTNLCFTRGLHDEDSSRGLITEHLRNWRAGDEQALDRLASEVYSELRRIAGAVMASNGPNPTIQPTVLVHELYLQLPEMQRTDWQSRGHFLNVAARVMRNILVDYARRRRAAKRGGNMKAVVIDPPDEDHALQIDVLLVHEALEKFSQRYPRQSKVAELRFFGGLTAEETADALNATGMETSIRSVERDWPFARAWLQKAIGG